MQQIQLPDWLVHFVLNPAQNDNILAMAYKGETERVQHVLATQQQTPLAMITPGNRTTVYLAALGGSPEIIKVRLTACTRPNA